MKQRPVPPVLSGEHIVKKMEKHPLDFHCIDNSLRANSLSSFITLRRPDAPMPIRSHFLPEANLNIKLMGADVTLQQVKDSKVEERAD